MKIAATAAVLGLLTVAASGCDREPTSRTAYNNSGASAAGTSPDAVPAPAAPNIMPPSPQLQIPTPVPSEPAVEAPAQVSPAPATANPAQAPAPSTAAPSSSTAVPDTASPSVPPAPAK